MAIQPQKFRIVADSKLDNTAGYIFKASSTISNALE